MNKVVCKKCFDKSEKDIAILCFCFVHDKSCDICGHVLNANTEDYFPIREHSFEYLKQIGEK